MVIEINASSALTSNYDYLSSGKIDGNNKRGNNEKKRNVSLIQKKCSDVYLILEFHNSKVLRQSKGESRKGREKQ